MTFLRLRKIDRVSYEPGKFGPWIFHSGSPDSIKIYYDSLVDLIHDNADNFSDDDHHRLYDLKQNPYEEIQTPEEVLEEYLARIRSIYDESYDIANRELRCNNEFLERIREAVKYELTHEKTQ